jgi:hypothetical protein
MGVGFKGQYLEACFMCNHVEDQDSWLILFSNHLSTFFNPQYYEEWRIIKVRIAFYKLLGRDFFPFQNVHQHFNLKIPLIA